MLYEHVARSTTGTVFRIFPSISKYMYEVVSSMPTRGILQDKRRGAFAVEPGERPAAGGRATSTQNDR